MGLMSVEQPAATRLNSLPNPHRHSRYMLILLTVILALNFTDRIVLSLVLESIKHDLGLSDTQLGLLSGLAFALFYSVMAVPIARWSDRGNRVSIISGVTVVWGIMMAATSFAASFAQLLLLRVAVAVGEAGCLPPAQSLIAEKFERRERARAVAFYMAGAPIGVILGYLLGGALNASLGWRLTFACLGVMALPLALVVFFTLRDPRFTRSVGKHASPLPLRTVLATLFARNSFRNLAWCFALASFFGYGILQWQPTYFVRQYGLGTGEIGLWFAGVSGVGSLIGTYLGGEVAARFAAGNEALQLRLMAFGYVVFGVFSALVYLSPNPYWALACMAIAMTGGATVNGPLFAILQTIVPESMRATAVALVYFMANLVGLGLGPLGVGALSDVLTPHLGNGALGIALLALCPGYLWVAWHLMRGARSVLVDIAATERTDAAAKASAHSD